MKRRPAVKRVSRRDAAMAAVRADMLRMGFIKPTARERAMLRKVERDEERAVERWAALRFLRRACGGAKNWAFFTGGALTAKQRAKVPGISTVQRDCLWRIVVAASHKSGRFES